jgi:hypothetical protein
MKNDVMPSIVQMGPDELRTLLMEVKETVATGIEMPEAPKKFGIADLWNIRRNVSSASGSLRR